MIGQPSIDSIETVCVKELEQMRQIVLEHRQEWSLHRATLNHIQQAVDDAGRSARLLHQPSGQRRIARDGEVQHADAARRKARQEPIHDAIAGAGGNVLEHDVRMNEVELAGHAIHTGGRLDKLGVGNAAVRAIPSRLLEHGGRRVNPDHVRHGTAERNRQPANATAKIQRPSDPD